MTATRTQSRDFYLAVHEAMIEGYEYVAKIGNSFAPATYPRDTHDWTLRIHTESYIPDGSAADYSPDEFADMCLECYGDIDATECPAK